MNSLIELVYDFFRSKVFYMENGETDFDLVGVSFPVGFSNGEPYFMDLATWLSVTATIISVTIILVLCCLFVYKIIRLIGGLIR